MLFNSLEFIIFFIVVVSLYYLLSHRWQNKLLLITSYFFYGWWDWRFLSLIFLSTVVDYYCGSNIYNQTLNENKKKYLVISILVNLTLLGFFKYWNFFVDNLASLFIQFGLQPNIPLLGVAVPVGISFYTFQTMTYSIDIYRRELEPTKSFLDFALFVSFFPQLVAGPIERAASLLPQIQNKRQYNKTQFVRGLQLIFQGLIKKVVVADNLAIVVNSVYTAPHAKGVEYIIATIAFAFQIYGDFSGYSDVARGTAKCLGFELIHNFNHPYLAVNPSDFWKRWHMSLSSWIMDYIYIPLGGNRIGLFNTYRNLMLSMLLCGLWHGAAWNFVLWGGYHGAILCIHRLFIKNSKLSFFSCPDYVSRMLRISIMFVFTCFGWILFRANSFTQIKVIIISISQIQWNSLKYVGLLQKVIIYAFIPIFVMIFQDRDKYPLAWIKSKLKSDYFLLSREALVTKSVVYGILIYVFCFYGAKAQTFIYFQF